MATKPATIYTFATDAVFGSGPASGLATKLLPGSLLQGFIPGDGINAEWVNYLFNVTGQWVSDWLFLGASALQEDAHIVETDSAGATNLVKLSMGAITPGSIGPALLVDGTNYIGPQLVQVDAASGSAIGATNSAADGTYRASNSGSGPAFRGFNTGTGPGATLEVIAGSGVGLSAIGGPGGGAGGIFTGGGTVGHGLTATSTGTGAAGGIFTATMLSTEAVLQALRSGAGTPARGTIFIDATGEPTAPLPGDVWRRPGFAGFGRGSIQWWDEDGAAGGGGAGKQTAWSTENGLGYGYAESLGDTSESAGVLTTKVTLNLGTAVSPGVPGGDYIVEFSGLTRITAGLASRTIVEFHDAGGLIDQVEEDYAALTQKKSFFFQHKISLPSGGTNALSIRFYNVAGAGTSVISQAKIVARGAYEA